MKSNNKILGTMLVITISALFSTGLMSIQNVANAQSVDEFDYSIMKCAGMFNNCDSTIQECNIESGEAVTGVFHTETCALGTNPTTPEIGLP